MNKESIPAKTCPLRRPLVRQSLKYLLTIWLTVLVSSLLYYQFGNSAGRSYWYLLNAGFYYINIPLFCYALLSMVAERGLFNGIRYSLKHAKAFFFKRSRTQMMDEYAVNSGSELKQVLQEKYLYTSPKSRHTLPLLISSGLTFLIMVAVSLL
ncbi:DUF3899 domain-containing protein [Clostridiales bacterium COT073_COT-073]|nr:DUF3899 domain-containing protein [Clostridiales bacterium COT073_COT-073]